MSEGSVGDDLRALGRALDRAQPPAGLRTRVLESGAGDRHRRTWVAPALAFAAGVLVTLALRPRESQPTPSPTSADPVEVAIADAPTVAASCARPLRREAIAIAAPCRIEVDRIGVVLDVWSPAQIALADRRLVLVEGAATFDVAPVGNAPPVEIDVGAGIVRVLGTRFEIQNTGDVGHLDLIHGRVEFHDREGGIREVTPGVRLSWDRRALAKAVGLPQDAAMPQMPPPEPAAPVPPRAVRSPGPRPVAVDDDEPADDLEALLDAVARHRVAGEITRAEALVTGALRRLHDPGTAEVLSFELGTLLELGDDTSRTCEHWRAHSRRFIRGTSQARVAGHRARLGCDEGDE